MADNKKKKVEHPMDTLAGIKERVQALRPGKQCPSTLSTRSGRNVNIVFCEHDEGHEGEHKGFRKRWPNREVTP